jgi:hypothetical protein
MKARKQREKEIPRDKLSFKDIPQQHTSSKWAPPPKCTQMQYLSIVYSIFFFFFFVFVVVVVVVVLGVHCDIYKSSYNIL